MTYRPLLLAFILLGGLLVVPGASAAPTILPTSSSAYAVQATDYIEIPVGCANVAVNAGCAGVPRYEITAPDGQQLILQRDPFLAPTTGTDYLRYSLSGAFISGSADTFDATGNLVGAPGDGTWQLEAVFYSVAHGSAIKTLAVDGKSLLFTGTPIATGQNYRLDPIYWNFRSSGASFTYPNCFNTPTDPGCPSQAGPYNPTAHAESDPNNAVFFRDGAEYTAYTLNFSVTCSASPTMSITGAWIGATGTTFSSHIYRDGNFLGTEDLRTVAGSTVSAEENEGSTGSGTDTEAPIPYNNVAGTSYQFRVRTTAQGETLGAVAFAGPGQCATDQFDPTANTEHDQNAFFASASQAQCRNDKVTLSVTMQDNPSGLTEHLTHIYVFDADAGTPGVSDPVEVLHLTTPQLYRTAPSTEAHAHYASVVFPPGNYLLYGLADYTGVGAVDYIATDAFNVPEGDCIWREPDLSGIYLALSLLEGNITEILETLDLVFDCTANCTINANLTQLINIADNLTEHREHTIEVTMHENQFAGLGFDGLLLLILWVVLLAWALSEKSLWIAAFATIGLIDTILPDDVPFGFAEWFVAVLVGAWLEWWSRRRVEGKQAKEGVLSN